MFCCTLLYVYSSIAIILMGKRELIALLNLSSWCLVMVERLFLAVPRGCLQFVIVVFPDHTHLLFFFITFVIHFVEIIIPILNKCKVSLISLVSVAEQAGLKWAKIRKRYNQVPQLTRDTNWENDNVTIRHHRREPRGQPFPSR